MKYYLPSHFIFGRKLSNSISYFALIEPSGKAFSNHLRRA